MNDPQQTILIIEDEVDIAEIVLEYLQREGYHSIHVLSGIEAIKILNMQSVDLLLLDVNLPGMSGFDLCREIRKKSQIPIIMATARVEEIDRLIGLELGADDYICKPYSPREVVARVKSVLRRSTQMLTGGEDNKQYEIDREAFSFKVKGHRVDLTPSEFKLIAALAQKNGRVMSRSQLLDVLSDDVDVFDRTVDSHIKNIRKKIMIFLPDQEVIQTVYGVGYRFHLF